MESSSMKRCEKSGTMLITWAGSRAQTDGDSGHPVFMSKLGSRIRFSDFIHLVTRRLWQILDLVMCGVCMLSGSLHRC